MSVVLRCPNCGTTQATPGECDACHEAEVRYFCTNHTPGIWLDGPTCPQCAARPAPSPAPPRPRPPRVEAAPDWDRLVHGAELARRRAEVMRAPSPAAGWLLQLVKRLAMIGLVVLAALVAAVYWLVHSLE